MRGRGREGEREQRGKNTQMQRHPTATIVRDLLEAVVNLVFPPRVELYGKGRAACKGRGRGRGKR